MAKRYVYYIQPDRLRETNLNRLLDILDRPASGKLDKNEGCTLKYPLFDAAHDVVVMQRAWSSLLRCEYHLQIYR